MPLFSNRSFLVKMVSDKDAPQGEPVEETIDLNSIKEHVLRYAPYYILIGGFLWNVSHGQAPTEASAVTVRPIALLARQDVTITVMQPMPQNKHAL
jgi:hypothetical protein